MSAAIVSRRVYSAAGPAQAVASVGVEILDVPWKAYAGLHGAVNYGPSPEALEELEQRLDGRRVRRVAPGVYVLVGPSRAPGVTP